MITCLLLPYRTNNSTSILCWNQQKCLGSFSVPGSSSYLRQFKVFFSFKASPFTEKLLMKLYTLRIIHRLRLFLLLPRIISFNRRKKARFSSSHGTRYYRLYFLLFIHTILCLATNTPNIFKFDSRLIKNSLLSTWQINNFSIFDTLIELQKLLYSDLLSTM